MRVDVRPADTCTVDGCDRPRHARGWCGSHYQRWRATGDPGGPAFSPRGGPAAARFWAKVDKRPDGCWIWTGNTTGATGYGRFHHDGRMVVAHRWAYETGVAPIPDGLQIDHLCRVKLCVNPAHLEPVTNQENVKRAVAVRTHCPNGHEYPEGVTRCQVCVRLAQRRYQERKAQDPAWVERRRAQDRARARRGKEQRLVRVNPPS